MHGVYPMGINGLGGAGEIEGIGGAPFVYIPDLAPVGSKAAYFPRDVERDAAALVFLHFMSDEDDANRNISRGSQAADMANEGGAWDPAFRAAVTRFQVAGGLTADSWIGPATRTGILNAVTQANLKGLGGGPVPPLPPAVIPVIPGQVPTKPNPTPLPGVTPAKTGPAGGEDETMTYVAIGAAAVALLAIGWYAFK